MRRTRARPIRGGFLVPVVTRRRNSGHKGNLVSQNGLPSLLERHWAESALAIGAVVIAAVSLWVAYDTERTNRELVASERQLVAANSWPFVQSGESDSTPEGAPGAGVSLMIMNNGIGPAKIETFALAWKGQEQRGPKELLRACCSKAGSSPDQPVDFPWLLDHFETSSAGGRVVRAGETVNFLVLPRGSAGEANWLALRSALLENLSLDYCYCSAFDTCWLVKHDYAKSHSLNPPQVKVCPQPKVTYSNAGL